MKHVGLGLWMAGVLVFLFAVFVLDVSVSTDGIAGSNLLPSRVVNLQLQQIQLLVALAGLSMFVSGTIVQAIGQVAERKALATPSAEVTKVLPKNAIEAEAGPINEQEEMQKHGIIFVDGQYHFGPYRYDKLADAIAYAKLETA